jgi:radical SAM protein with 4Fe4S-binding SPASM domain
MIKYAKQKEMACGLSTNASFLTEEIGRRICTAGLDTIVFSIDATTSETYDKIRPGGNFERVIENTERFMSLPERKIINNTIIQMIKFADNQHEVDAFIDKWKSDSCSVHIKHEETWAGHFSKEMVKGSTERFPCRKLWERLTVDWQGNISICCRDFKMMVQLGNIAENSFQEVWNGARMISLRKSIISNDLDAIPLCKNCSEWVFSNNHYRNYECY